MSVRLDNLSLYVWRGADVLPRYGYGIAFALAYSADQARQILREKLTARDGPWWWCDTDEHILDDDDKADRARQLTFLTAEPEVFNEPVALYQMGSD